MKRGRKLWGVGWRLLVCLGLLGWLVHNIFLKEGRDYATTQGLAWDHLTRWAQWTLGWQQGPPELWRHLTLIGPGPFALSILLMGLTLLVGILRWRMVLRVHGLDLSFGRVSEISFVAHFFNSFLLGATGGDLMKAYYAARETHHKKTEAVAAVFMDRLIGFWAMLFFAGLMMLPNLGLLGRHERLRSVAVLMLLGLGGCSAVMSLLLWGGVSRRWSGARAWMRRLPKGAWLEHLLDSCRHFGRSWAFLGRALAASMALNGLCVAQVLVLAWGLGLHVPPAAFFLIVPSIICLASVPITPSGLGVRENLYVFALAAPALQVAAPTALSLSLLAYAGSLFWSLVGGVVYLLFKQRHHLAAAELESGGNAKGSNLSPADWEPA